MICQGLEDCVFDINTAIETNKTDWILLRKF